MLFLLPLLLFSPIRAQQNDEIPELWKEMCVFPEIPISGAEGLGNSTLKGILVLFRHGERSGISGHDDENGCFPYREEDQEAFENYANLEKSEDFQEFVKIDGEKKFSQIPEKSRCASGQLTAEGALQHLALGRFLNSRYLDLLGSNPRITAISTSYNRTVQSLVANLAGFLFPAREKLDKIDIQVINNTLMCAESKCMCPDLDNVWWKKAWGEEYHAYRSMAPNETREIVDKLGRIPPFKGNEEPYQILDTALSKVICRHRNLPCSNETCASFKDLTELLALTTIRGDYWFARKDKYMRNKADHIKTYSILSQLTDEVKRLTQNGEKSFIRLLSAHDVTIAAVLRVLGVSFVDPPRYAARIVFEVYRGPSLDYSIRVIYNGKDVTKEVDFCDEDICSAEKFNAFLPEIFTRLGIQSLSDICFNGK